MNIIKDDFKMFYRMILLAIADAIFVVLASFLAMFIRMEFQMDWELWFNYVPWIWLDIVITLGVFHFFKLYKSLWTFASMPELREMIFAIVTCAFIKVMVFALALSIVIPRSWYVMEPMVLLILCSFTRFSYRNLRSIKNNSKMSIDNKIMIVGAGEAGNILLRETLLSSHVNQKVVCLIDDDPVKKGKYMNNVPIVGNRDTIIDNVKKYEVTEIYIAMPSAMPKDRSDIVKICETTGCQLKILPGIYQMMSGEVSISKLRDVEIEDLLGRDPIDVDIDQIGGYIKDKVIMITGGGGSIGSELARQVAARDPKQLVIVDIYENNAYNIQMELLHNYPDLNLAVRIASIRDNGKIDKLFDEFRPDIVYHAAAHKHVPLMEDSPNEAIKNNVFGTLNLVKAADKYGVSHFVQISTDKAVNPTNIMGATKRICEMIIQAYSKKSETIFAAVRFGNVLGSNGSVIPLFKKQIEQGGPVTVTDKNIIRYFMTIPEAVSLVMQAGVYAKGGEIFVLDMGEPVKIDDLARNLIKLSGYTPDVDIPIVYTGLRPGEKLYEELLMNEEGLQKTQNNSIFIGHPIEFDETYFFKELRELRLHANMEEGDIKELVHKIVPTYQPYIDGGK
ncbi:MAG: polysaccharide biosynthesis protein [Erysipelotrichaceae bacterium]|nr:polysaccharide biosynthesis protein [Erysipelotrichaceae bacterium]